MAIREIVALCVCAFSLAAMPVHAVESGEAAPAFTAARLDAAGQPLGLASLRGQVVYVDFWASWCVPCRLSMPALDALYAKNQSRGFVVVGINKDVAAADAQRFLERVRVSFPLVADGDDAIARSFRVKAMPSGYLIDRRGTVRYVHRGFTAETGAALEKQVDGLLNEGS